MFEDLDGWKLISLLFSIFALLIGGYNLCAQLRACIVVSLKNKFSGGSYFLVIKNSGPGTATVENVRGLEKDGSLVDFDYAGDRKLFPFRLGRGASYELTLTRLEASYLNVHVEWKDGFRMGRSGKERLPISQFVRTVQ